MKINVVIDSSEHLILSVALCNLRVEATCVGDFERVEAIQALIKKLGLDYGD